MKTTIIASIATSLITVIIYQMLSWWVILLGVWVFLGFVARKISSLTHMKNDPFWNYGFCNVVPPIIIAIQLPEVWSELKEKYSSIFNKLPKFRNPFVWAEKSD